MSEIDRIEVAITADTSNVEAGLQRVTQKATEFDSKIKTVGSSDFGDKISAEADQAVSGFKRAEDAADSLVSKLKNLDIGSGLAGVSKVTGGVADGMQKIGLAATAVGVPVGLLAKNSLSMFADLESQTQRNTALLGGAKAEYEEILALSKELGASTPFDALEIGAGIESLAAAGYSLKEIQSAMPTVAEMAIATGEDLSSMSEILIATLSSYGEGADKAAMYGDKLATVANISSAGIGDFGESMKYVGAVANAFGVDIDELGASIATLADNNLKGSLAGTGLREIITTLANPTAKVRDIFESFGLTMDELNPKTNDFVDILAKMKDAGVSSEAMMAAFGDRAGPAAVILLEQIDKLKENYKTLLTESDGMLKEFSGKMRDTLGFVMDEMGGTIGNIMIEIGAGLKPIVQEMGKWLNENQQTLIDFAKNAVEGLTPFVEKFLGLAEKLMEWFNSLPKDMQSKIAGLTGLGAAMATIGGPLLLLGSLPVRAISDVTGALAGLFTVAKTATGAGGLAGLAGEVAGLGGAGGLAGLAGEVAGLGGAGGLAGLAGEVAGLGGAAGGATPALAALFGPAGILAVGLGAGALAAYATNFGQFRDNINGVIGELGEAASNISTGDYEQAGRDCAEAFGKGLESIADVTIAAISSLPDAANALNEFKTGFDVAVSEIVEGFTSGLTTGIISSVESIQWPDLSQDMQSVYKSMLGKSAYEANMNAAIADIKSSFANIDLTSAGVSIMGTLFSGMSGAIPGLSGTLTGILEATLKGTVGVISNSMIDNIAKEFGLSPSEVQAMLKGQGPFGIGDTLAKWHEESYKKDTSDPDRVIKKYYDELVAQGVTPTAAQTQAYNKYYQNRSAHSGDYLKPDDVTTGTQTGVEAAAPEIGGSVADALSQPVDLVTKLMEERNIQSREDAQKMFDSSEKLRERLSRDYGTNQPKTPAGTASDPLVVTTTNSNGAPSSSATNTGLTVAENDRFNQNPLQFFLDDMETILNNFGSKSEYEAFLKEGGSSLENKARQVFRENNQGGSWNQDDWVNTVVKGFRETGTEAKTTLPTLESLASKIQSLGLNTKQTAGVLFEYNAAMDDGVAKNGEALGYLAKWNHETGKATKYTEENVNQTTDLMNALGSLNNAQSLYKDAMSDGKVTSEEASGIQQALAESTRLMGEAGVTATSDISGLPGALQALASAAQSAMSQINAAISMANAQLTNVRKVGDWTLQTMSGITPTAPSTQTNFKFASGGPVTENGPAYLHQGEYVLRRDEVNKLTSGSPNVSLNINMSNSRFGNAEMAKDLPKRIARATKSAMGRRGVGI